MKVPVAIRKLIIRLRSEGQSLRKIAKTIGKSHATVQYIIDRHKELKIFENRPRLGRPRKLQSIHRRAILKAVRENPKISAPTLRNDIEDDYNISVVPETIRNVLRREGYHGRVPRRKPYISKKNKCLRLEFAKAHVNKPNSFWETVLFSDESKFNIYGSDGRIMVWRKKNEHLKPANMCPTVKHGGGGVLVWGCMSASGVGKLKFIETIMDQHVYLDILRENLKSSAEKLNLGNFIFQ
ncbi:Transposable element Tc1 transposase [Anthophora plagiata]